MVFKAEAEVRWLDHTEAVVARAELPAPSPFGPYEDSAEPSVPVEEKR